MSTDPTATSEQPAAPLVAAVIAASDAELVSRCLDAIGEQVYEVARVIVVGGDDDIRHVTGEAEALWRPTLRAAIDSIGSEFTFVWALRERAIPDPQALRVLVQDAQRVDASVAGSKIVDADDPELLVSVGYATDAFGAPYSGLEPGEVDQAQYDVIRDVAAVSGVSVLIRRDLYLGLGGIDRVMAPTAAAIDFCQRARLRGGRVVVIPRSVVGFDGDEQSADWRERGGEIRSLIKSYGPLTLAWTLPVVLLLGLIESVARIPFGRFPLPGVLGGWLWNVIHLPSALRQRIQVRRGREVGDEELFRYQVSGSARLRLLWDEAMLRIRDRFPEGVLSGFADAVEAGQQRVRHPAFFVGAFVVAFGLIATREIWTDRLPISGFALPPPDSAGAVLGSYAGGWNPAGLGSPEVLRPSVAAVALVQLLALGNGGLAVAVITVGAFLAGGFGAGRLLRVWGVESISGYLAGVVLMAGPALSAAAGASHWAAIPAFAAVPLAVRAVLLAGSARTRRDRLIRLAGAALATGIVGVFVPLALVVPLIAVALWVVVGVGARMRPLLRSIAATAAAVPLLFPWLLYQDLGEQLRVGAAAFWEPGWIAVGLLAITAGAVIGAGDRVMSALGTWGAAMIGVGALAARGGGFDLGAEVFLAGLVLVGLGTAVVVGAGLEVASRRKAFGGLRRSASLAAGLAATAVAITTLALAGPGRAGLPDDSFSGQFDFAVPAEGSPQTRVLLFGAPDSLPGSERTIDGLGYRLFIPPYPTSWEAHLGSERLGDRALAATLQELVDGRTRRGGSSLAEFGIGWIAFMEPSPLEAVFESQLDLVALRSLDFPVFRNEAAAPIAVAADGTSWSPDGAGFVGTAGSSGPVYVAVNADYRWGPGEWSQADWANQVVTQGDAIGFEGHGPRRWAAIGALIWLVGLGAVVAMPWYSRRRS